MPDAPLTLLIRCRSRLLRESVFGMVDVDFFVRDSFGEDVVACLGSVVVSRTLTWGHAWAPSTWSPDAITVFVSGTPDAELDSFVNQTCFDQNRSWISAVLEPRFLRVGPIVRGDGVGCFQCFQARQRQHRVRTTTDDFFDAARKSGMSMFREGAGYLPSHVHLASELILRGLGRLFTSVANGSDGSSWPAVYRVGLSHTRVEEFRITPVHGCHVCSGMEDFPLGESTTTSRLAGLSEVL